MKSRSLLVMLSVAAILGGCSRSAPQPDAGQQQAAQAPGQPPAAAPTAPAATAPAPVAGAGSCAAAALTMQPTTVVATVGDKSITAGELSPEVVQAEQKALADYCSEVHRIRSAAVDRAVDDALLTKAAGEAGKDMNAYLQGYVESKVQPPTDEEIQAYYDKVKNDTAPPLDQVKDQVARAIVDERQRDVFQGLITELRSKAGVKVSLPDIRPPAIAVDVPEHAPTLGSAEATVKVVEFSDFECPYCARAAETVNAVKAKFGDKVQFAYRHFPLSFHPNAMPAAEYSQCAHEQDKFWPMHDEIFANQKQLSPDNLKASAEKAGLDMEKLQACLDSGRAKQAIQADMAKAQEIGVGGTPTIYINGRKFEDNLTPEALTQAIDAALAQG